MLKSLIRYAQLVCLALGVFIILMWAWSYHEVDQFTIQYQRLYIRATSVRGTSEWNYSFGRFGRGSRTTFQWLAFEGPKGTAEFGWIRNEATWLDRRGFRMRFYDGFAFGDLTAPHWFIALILLLIAFAGSIQQTLMKRMPSVPRTVRPRLLRVSRLLVIAVITAVVAVPIVVLSARFTVKEAWAALVNTPMMCGVFLVIPLVGIWLVRKPLRVQRKRLMIHRDRYLCTSCGYNLTKNTTGICPECGAESMRLMKKHESEK